VFGGNWLGLVFSVWLSPTPIRSLIAARYSLALPEAIYGVGVKSLVRLPSKETITAKAELLIKVAESTIEVHDYFPAIYF
jgi:hypothetical protein